MVAHFLTKDVSMNLVQAAGFPFSSVGLPRTWIGFGAPSFKIDAVFEMHRKNADAVVRATYVMLDGLNRMAQRQGELFAATVNDHANAARDVFAHASFEEKASKQVGAVRHLYDSSVASLQEQSDITAETNVTVGDILSTRVNEALDEFGVLFGKPGAPAAASSVAAAAITAEPEAAVDAAIIAEPPAGVGAAVVAEPAAGVGEAAADNGAALVDAVPIAGPAAKFRPKKASLPTKPARRPTSRS